MSIEEVKNEQLGEVWCPFQCGSVAYVFKNKRKSLYAQCPVCKCIQPTGAPAQAYFSQYQPIGTLRGQPRPEAPKTQSETPRDDVVEAPVDDFSPPAPEARPKKGGFLGLMCIVLAAGAVLGISK